MLSFTCRIKLEYRLCRKWQYLRIGTVPWFSTHNHAVTMKYSHCIQGLSGCHEAYKEMRGWDFVTSQFQTLVLDISWRILEWFKFEEKCACCVATSKAARGWKFTFKVICPYTIWQDFIGRLWHVVYACVATQIFRTKEDWLRGCVNYCSGM